MEENEKDTSESDEESNDEEESSEGDGEDKIHLFKVSSEKTEVSSLNQRFKDKVDGMNENEMTKIMDETTEQLLSSGYKLRYIKKKFAERCSEP